MTKRTALILVGSIAILLPAAACDAEAAPPAARPSSAFPSETPGVSAPSGATGITGVPGVSTVPPAASDLDSGELTLQLSGDLEAETTIANLVSGVYAPPPGGMAMVWTAGGSDVTTVGIGGSSFVGSRPTAPSLSLTISAPTPDGIAQFLSMGGECTVTIDVATPRELAGSFACEDLVDATGLVVDVSASFRATG